MCQFSYQFGLIASKYRASASLLRRSVSYSHRCYSHLADTDSNLETDNSFPAASRHRAEEILAEIKATYHVQLFSGVSHGFGTRGDPKVENERTWK